MKEVGGAYLCGPLDVLQVAGDEAGLLLLVVVRHCGMCVCVSVVGVCKVLLCVIDSSRRYM